MGEPFRVSHAPHAGAELVLTHFIHCSNSSIFANFFPEQIKRVACLARATHACVIHSFSKGEKRGTQCTERLKWQEMSRSEKWTRFCETIFLGKGSQNRD